MSEAGETATKTTNNDYLFVDGRSEIARLEDEVHTLREEMYELHNQEESHHSLIANAIERVRYMVMNQQIEDLSTNGLKKELRKRQALKKNRQPCE